MWLDELKDLVDELRQRIDKHGRMLAKSESTTRYALIDPLLGKIGWRLADPSHVLTEYVTKNSKRLDYAMLHGEKECLVVEAKAFDKKLGDSETDQAIQYCYTVGCRHFVVTNGDQWKGYDLYAEGDLGEKLRFDFSVTGRTGIMELFWLWPGNFEGTPARPKLHRQPSAKRVSLGDRNSAPSPRSAPTAGTPLSDVRYETGMGKPGRLRFPDGNAEDVSRSWRSVQSATVQWLVDTRRMAECPVKNKNGTVLVNETPTSANGTRFTDYMEVRESIFINTHLDPANHLRKAQEILAACGVDPDTVSLEFD